MTDSPQEPSPLICNVEAESALIGGMMMDNNQIERAAGIVSPDDFSDDLHRRLFKTICHLRKTGSEANPVTMQGYFADEKLVRYRNPLTGMMEDFSIIQYLITLCSTSLILGVIPLAEQIKMLATMRRASEIALQSVARLQSLSVDDGDDAESIISTAASAMLTEIEHISEVKVERASSIMGRVRKRVQRQADGQSPGCECHHLPELTELCGPLEAGQMTILAGRPGMGKSVLAQNIAWGVARRDDPTIFISEELGEEVLAMRLAADISHAMGEPIKFSDIIRGKLQNHDLLAIDEAAARIDKIPLFMVAPKNRSIDEIEARVAQTAAALKRKGQKLRLIVVDYLQLVTVPGAKRHMDARELTNLVSSRLIDIAKRYGCHMLALSQLSRSVDQRDDKRPKLSDLKESGKLEEDASNVLFAYREEYYLSRNLPRANDPKAKEEWNADMERSKGVLELICAKSRASDVGTREIKFIGAYQAVRSGYWRPLEIGEASDLI